jgi:hypothetical protein
MAKGPETKNKFGIYFRRDDQLADLVDAAACHGIGSMYTSLHSLHKE